MTRKQWINSLTHDHCLLIHKLIILPTEKSTITGGGEDFRMFVRNYLRAKGLNERHINIQKGRLAAGLPILPLTKLLCS